MGKKRSGQTGSKGRFLQSIRGKIFLMGGTAVIASVILGAVGIVSLKQNNSNQDVLSVWKIRFRRQSNPQAAGLRKN